MADRDSPRGLQSALGTRTQPVAHEAKRHNLIVAPAGFEPATHGLGNRRSIP